MGKKAKKNKIYFTITGMNYFLGQDFLVEGMKVQLKKEPDNKFDKEAILVIIPGIGAIGHVANSAHTVKGDSYSAGRLYDLFGKKTEGKIKYVLGYGAIGVLKI